MAEMTQTSAIPEWPLASSETKCVIGKHGMADFAQSIIVNTTQSVRLSPLS